MVKKVKAKSLSRVQLLVTPGTAAHQAPPSMGFSRQGYWSGVAIAFSTLEGRCIFGVEDHHKESCCCEGVLCL